MYMERNHRSKIKTVVNESYSQVIDDVIDGLARSYKVVVGDLGSYKKKRSLTPDVLKVIFNIYI